MKKILPADNIVICKMATTTGNPSSLDEYTLTNIDDVNIGDMNYNVLNDIMNMQGIRIIRQHDAVNNFKTVRGQVLTSKFKLQDLSFPQGYGTLGLKELDESIKPDIGTNYLYAVEETKEASSLLGEKHSGKSMVSWFVFSPKSSKPLLIIQRPFKAVFHKLYVYDGLGTYFGSVIKRTGLLKSKIVFIDSLGNEIYSLKNSKMKDWSEFWLKGVDSDEKVGLFTTKWASRGVMSKASPQEPFDILFPSDSTLSNRCLLIGGGLFMDMLCFETTK